MAPALQEVSAAVSRRRPFVRPARIRSRAEQQLRVGQGCLHSKSPRARVVLLYADALGVEPARLSCALGAWPARATGVACTRAAVALVGRSHGTTRRSLRRH